MTAPLVSTIVPVYNAEAHLDQAIRSVLAQSYTPTEVILVDDGSTDRSPDLAASFGDRVRLIRQPNHGAAHARNHGLQVARGDLVAFLDADDVRLPHKLERQVEQLQTAPNAQYSIGKIRHFLEPGKVVPPGFKKDLLDRDVVGRLLGTLLARRAVFDVVGPLDDSLTVAHDTDWFVRANELGIPMVVLDDVVMLKRIHEDNISHQAAVNSKELLQLFRRSIRRRQ